MYVGVCLATMRPDFRWVDRALCPVIGIICSFVIRALILEPRPGLIN
jgi:hypothetical protein